MTILRNLILAAFVLALVACSGAEQDTELPEDLAGKKEVLRELRTEFRDLNQRIKEVEGAIAEQDPDFGPKAAVVTVTTVGKQGFKDYSNLQATVQADETATAAPQLPGRILSMRVDEGDNVRKGQLIATIDAEDITVQRSELETSLALAKTVYERQERLWNQKIGSELQYLEAKNNYERLQKGLESIGVTYNKRNVFAPISGTVDRVFMRAGENAMPGAPIVSIISTGKLKIVADAPEEFLTRIKNGQKVKVTVPALGESFEAPVSRIGKTVDAANRTFVVEVNVPRGQANKLKTNLLAQVEVLDKELNNVIVVSQDLVQQEISGRRYVFVAAPGEEPNTTQAKKVYVETGDAFDNQVVVTSGLDAGDQLILTGSRGLVDGQLISFNVTESPATNGK